MSPLFVLLALVVLASAQCFCPDGKCLPCPNGGYGCFPWSAGACCGCYAGSCWACPRPTQCNQGMPNWCNSTCATTRCQWPAVCKVCLDGNEACFGSTFGVCCGCLNGNCWQCDRADQCDLNRPGWCSFKRAEGWTNSDDSVVEHHGH